MTPAKEIEQQVKLMSGTEVTTGVVKWHRLLTVGTILTLKDTGQQQWTVVEAFELPRPIPRGWKNGI